MTQARRALKRPRSWTVLLVAVPVALLAAGLALLFGLNRYQRSGDVPISEVVSIVASGLVETPGQNGQPSGPAISRALDACRAKVSAADNVLAVAKEGMGHWAEHIQAQTDANAEKISIKKMNEIFDRTMAAGHHDEERYADAVQAYRDQQGRCDPTAETESEIGTQLAQCAERERAQQPLLNAAEDGIEDWTKHLADMRRSKKGQIHNPQKKWLQTWRAAPKNINAYEEAAEKFTAAPTC
jgi:hypothetical protein